MDELIGNEQCHAGKFIEGVASQCNLDEGHDGAHEYYKGLMGMRVFNK